MPKDIKLAKCAGFCYGVKRAVDTVKKLKAENPERNICVLGELIHNSHVIEELDALGIKSLTELPKKGDGICVVRSHGESPEVFEQIEKAGFEVYDLTCPDVKKVQQKAIEFAVGASCLKHTISGDFNLSTKQEILTLMAGDSSGRVHR